MAEKKVIELEIKTDSVGNLKAELRKAQAEVTMLAEKFGATSQEAINAAKKAAELKDAIADAKALTDAYNPDAKFNALSASIGGVLNGFQAFEGALGLVGVESENVQKALLQVQSAMALTQGINGVLEAKEDFARLGKQISDVYSGAVKGFQNMTAAGKAFALTGIGLLITGLGLVITYWDDIKKAVGGVSEEEQKLAEFRRKHEAERRDFVAKESAGFAMALSQLKATNKGSEERSKLISEINQKYGTTLKNLSDEKAFQQQINDELKNYLAYQTAKFKLQANEEAIVTNLKTQSKLKQQLAEDEKKLTQLQSEGALKRKEGYETDDMGRRISTGQTYANEQLAIQYEKTNKRIIENQKELAAAEKRFENYGKAALRAGSEISKLTDNGKKYSEQNKEVVKTTKETTEAVIEQTRKIGEVTAEEEEYFMSILTDADAEKKRLNDERIAREQEDELMLMQFRGDIYKQDVDNFDEAELKKKELKKQTNDFIFESTKQTLDIISGITELFGKKGEKEAKRAFEIQKAISIAQATIDTYKSANSIFASAAANPATVLFPAQPFIAAGLAVAAGLVNVAKIASQKFQSTSTASGGGSSVPSGMTGGAGSTSAITPNFNIVGNAQATNPLGNLGTQPIQAYVVSSEVTTAQNLDRNRVNYATFG